MIQANDEQAVIRQLQTMLRSIQIAHGDVVTVPVDGIYDTATRNAVEKIQRENGLAVTGKADLETYNLIYGMALEADFAVSEPLPVKRSTPVPSVTSPTASSTSLSGRYLADTTGSSVSL